MLSVSEKQRAERQVLTAVALCTVVIPLNSMMLPIALPRIVEGFSTNLANVSWLITIYLITIASLQPIAGKLGDRFGRRHLMLGALVYFSISSAGAGVAGTLPLLIFFRTNQAIAGAIILPNSSALIREVISVERRASSFGLISAAIAFAVAAGPFFSGLLLVSVGWRAIFYVNLAFAVPALLIGYQAIPKSSFIAYSSEKQQESPISFDLIGVVLLFAILAGIVGLLTETQELHMTATTYRIAGLLLIVVTIIFLWYEWQHPDPVFKLHLFKHRPFTAANITAAFSNVGIYSNSLTVPILLLSLTNWSDTQVGLVISILLLPMVVFAFLGGRLNDRFGRRWPTFIGLLIFALSALVVIFALDKSWLWLVLSSLGVISVGLGFSSSGPQTVAIESVNSREAGVASGVYAINRYIGSILGSSIGAILLDMVQRNEIEFKIIFFMIFLVALLSTIFSLGLHDFGGSD